MNLVQLTKILQLLIIVRTYRSSFQKGKFLEKKFPKIQEWILQLNSRDNLKINHNYQQLFQCKKKLQIDNIEVKKYNFNKYLKKRLEFQNLTCKVRYLILTILCRSKYQQHHSTAIHLDLVNFMKNNFNYLENFKENNQKFAIW